MVVSQASSTDPTESHSHAFNTRAVKQEESSDYLASVAGSDVKEALRARVATSALHVLIATTLAGHIRADLARNRSELVALAERAALIGETVVS